jgi:hypothetical protein
VIEQAKRRHHASGAAEKLCEIREKFLILHSSGLRTPWRPPPDAVRRHIGMNEAG